MSQALNERLGGYIDYGLSDCYIDHVVVNNIRLSFPKYDLSPTISVLIDQYSNIKNGEQLKLKTQEFIIDSSMPLQDITASPQKLQVFEKVLNNINDSEKQLEQNLKPEEKVIANTIFQKVEEHNVKIQLDKPFKEHTSLVTVTERSEFQSQFQFEIELKTQLLDLVKYIDDVAGSKVKAQSIKTKQGAIYYQNQFSKTFSQLNIQSKFLIVSYPPILKIGNNQLFKVRLVNSIYPKQVLEISVKKQSTIQFVLDRVRTITKYNKYPMQIKDSEGNIIEHERWGIELKELVFRSFQIVVFYPPFINYQCLINVLNLPNGSSSIKYLIRKTTTLNDIIKYIRSISNCYQANFEISNSKGQKYEYGMRDKSLHSLQIQEKMFKFMFIRPTCFISPRTKLIIKNPEKQGFLQRSAHQLFTSNSQKQLNILCYNQQKHKAQMGLVSFYKIQEGFSRLCQLTVQGEDQVLKIQCFEETTFINVNFEWKPAFLLEKRQKLIILRNDMQNLFFGQIIDKRIIGVPQDTYLYQFEVLPHHNFFANRMILHNDETIKLKVYFFRAGKAIQQEFVECYMESRFNEIQKFKKKRLFLGGLILDNDKTLGDYQVQNFSTLFAYDQGYIPQSKQKIISEWREKTFEVSEVNQNLKAKWASQCLGLRQSNIVELSRDQITLNNTNQPCHLLIAPKITLEKLHYVEQIAVKYNEIQEKAYKELFKPIIDNSKNYKQKLSAILKNKQNSLEEKDALLIYLYTTNEVYRDLNEFLRSKDKAKIPKQNVQKWYSLTNLLMRSLDNLPVFEYKTLYRGISNICIKNAFNRRQNRDKQSYIILNSFTSTSIDKQVAKNFIVGKGALLTITARCGKDIANYSHYGKNESEILLSPFIYFLITKFDPDSQTQQMQLEQIPFPWTNRKRLIFWVDDIPTNNTNVIRSAFQPDGIQVVQVISTRIMKVILRDFFGILQAIGKKIVIISDMTRFEQGVCNSEAGVDLFNLIYKEYKMSNKAIIFTMDKKRAQNAIAERGIKKEHWVVCDDERGVIEQVRKQFSR